MLQCAARRRTRGDWGPAAAAPRCAAGHFRERAALAGPVAKGAASPFVLGSMQPTAEADFELHYTQA